MASAEYVIGLVKHHPLTAIVAKFEGADEPSRVYKVEQMPSGRMKCDCPAYMKGLKRPCKHGEMVLREVTKK